MFPAFVLQNNYVVYQNNQRENFNFVACFSNDFHLSFGYNNDKIFTGLSVKNITFVDNLDKDGFYNYNATNVRLFFGFRFHKKYKLF